MLLGFGQTKLRSFYAYKNLFNGYTKVSRKILQGMFFFSPFFHALKNSPDVTAVMFQNFCTHTLTVRADALIMP
jgi:hypothetical protein